MQPTKHDGYAPNKLPASAAVAAFSPWFKPPSRRVRWMGTLAAFVLYALAFFAFYPLLGASVTSLSILPAVVAGWLLGMWPGFLVGVLWFPLNLILLNATGQPGWEILVHTGGGAMGSVLLPALGAVAGLVGSLVHQLGRELSARKLTEESLRESEAKYRNLVERAHDGIAIIQDERVRFANVTLATLWGGSVAEISGTPFTAYIHPDELSRLTDYYHRRLAGELVPPIYETVLLRKDGSARPVELNAGVIPYQSRPAVLLFIRDTSERQRTAAALRESEARYRLLFDRNPHPMWVYDTQTLRFLAVNDFAVQQYGYSRAEFLNMTIRDIRPLEDIPSLDKHIVKNMDMEVQTSGPWRHRIKDGSEITVEIASHALRFGDKQARLVLAQDITERMQAEQAVRRAEQRYRELFEDAPAMYVITTTVEGSPVIADCNGLFARTLGFSRDELVGRPLADVYTPASRSLLVEGYPRALTGKFTSEERELLTRDGRGLPTILRSTPERDAAGRVSGTRAMFVDISERKWAEEALRESEERYRDLVQHSHDLICIHDLTGNILSVNPAATRITGYTENELLKMNLQDILATSSRDRFAGYLDEIQAAGSARGVMYVQTKYGERRIWEYNNTLRTQGLAVPIVRGTATDITERKRAEEQLRRRLAELEALHTVSAALRTAQSVDEALPILLDETLAALGIESGGIWLYHPEHDDLRAVVVRGWFQQFGNASIKRGEGIGGTVFANGQTYCTADFRSDPLSNASVREQIPLEWSGACVPVRAGALTAGVLYVSLPAARTINPEQVTLLESLAEMGGAALHRMRLHEETVRQLAQLQALHDIDLAIKASVDLRITLSVLLGHVITQLQVDCAAVLLLDPVTQTLEYADGRGFRTHQAQTARIRVGEDFAGRAVQERRMVHATDAATAPSSPHFAALWQAEGLAAYYGVPLIAKGQVKGVLEVFHRAPLDPDPLWLEFLDTLAGQAAIAIDNAQLFEGLERSNLNLSLAYDATIEGWSRALDLRDKETEGHTQRVTALTLHLARTMGLSDSELVHIRRGALLHDIGKMGVPDGILLKPDSLSEAEWALMRKHPVYAYEMLAPIAYLQPALDIPYCHHEKWDGTGYPRGLKGEQIPLVARIFAVADVFDALRSDRPYRKAWPEAEVIAHIRAQAGKHFDPRVVDAFMADQASP